MIMYKPYISKSKYIKSLQCHKAFWFSYYRKDLKPGIDLETLTRFDMGNEVGKLAEKYFQNTAKVTDEYYDFEKSVKSTQNFIKQGYDVILEAAAINPKNNIYSRIDILCKANDDRWDLIEVKSATKVKDYHIDDMAFQYNTFIAAGFKINKCLIIFIDNSYVKNGDINPKNLFKLEDVTNQVNKKQTKIGSDITRLSDRLCK